MNMYGILDGQGHMIKIIEAKTSSEALREATKELGADARVAIITSQLEKEHYASHSRTPSTGTRTDTYASATPDASARPSPATIARYTTRGAWKPGTGKRGS